MGVWGGAALVVTKVETKQKMKANAKMKMQDVVKQPLVSALCQVEIVVVRGALGTVPHRSLGLWWHEAPPVGH
eukprot:8405972-Karenia_brevis.AAC.1